MKILHLSDLHICEKTIGKLLLDVAKEAENKFGQKFDIEVANESKLNSIKKAVDELDPDVICITGDITSFGDAASFEKAFKFVKELKESKKPNRTIVVTPGNHDILCSQLKALKNKLDNFKLISPKLFFLKLNKKINLLLSKEGIKANVDEPLSNYLKFISDSQSFPGTQSIGKIDNADIWVLPFNSVSNEPLWVNLGQSTNRDYEDFHSRLRNIPANQEALKIVLIHHNPISSPDINEPKLVHAYNSFPGASMFAKEMQDAGVDIVLYGHQHKSACCKIDFQPSKPSYLYLLGASSATADSNAGFSFIKIKTRFHGTVKQYRIKDTGSFEIVGSEEDLIFEKEKIFDHITLSTQNEVRHFRFAKPDSVGQEWDYMFRNNADNLLVVGPKAKRIRTPQRLKAFKNILDSDAKSEIRILVTDPGLFELIKDLPKPHQERLSEMWGKDKKTWENQSAEAAQTLEKLVKFKKGLRSGDKRKRFLIKVSHTLLPIGAVLRYSKKLPESVLVWLLPVGLMDDMEKSLLRLEPRHNDAAFSYYKDYLEKLWEAGEEK